MQKTIYIAGGCFWGVEGYYKRLKGVIATEVGYANGNSDKVNYQDLKNGLDVHAETVKITYDENIISLEKLLEHFLRFVDPYSINRQAHDEGIQYRSGVFYTDNDDYQIIKNYFDKNIAGKYQIQILPLDNYCKAEDYHQDYLDKNPNGYCHVDFGLILKHELK